jgi:Icc-related predicted phosphoesterase
MHNYFFVSDLHGSIDSYNKLFNEIEREKPEAVFFGGDLLPSGLFAYSSSSEVPEDFIRDILKKGFKRLKEKLEEQYPSVFIILGNDDSRAYEENIIQGETEGLWKYIHGKKIPFKEYTVFGYSYVPPSPFLMKDWEKYDVSRYVDPGCVPPEEGSHSYAVKKDDILYSTIQKDLNELTINKDLSKSIFLFHSPPYKTKLDRADLDGKMFDHAPLDVHIGSIAIQRFIQQKQPLITLHGHVHESASITGAWYDTIGNTHMYSAAHKGKELAIVKFKPDCPEKAIRVLL